MTCGAGGCAAWAGSHVPAIASIIPIRLAAIFFSDQSHGCCQHFETAYTKRANENKALLGAGVEEELVENGDDTNRN